KTLHGAFVLRRIRNDQPDDRVAIEHATIDWVAARGLPAPAPMTPTCDQARVHDDALPPTCVRVVDASSGATEESRWVLFPFTAGSRIPRGMLNAAHAAALGDMHGRLHALLHDHPRSADARFEMTWSVERSATMLERIEEIARSSDASAEALEGIAIQR